MAECLAEQGRGRFASVRDARQNKAEFFHTDRSGFLDQLRRELLNFERVCERSGERGAVRLNVLSDIDWTKLGIPQAFPNLLFVDYTKCVTRVEKTPDNYRLIFSYSGRPQYRNQNRRAFRTNAPWR